MGHYHQRANCHSGSKSFPRVPARADPSLRESGGGKQMPWLPKTTRWTTKDAGSFWGKTELSLSYTCLDIRKRRNGQAPSYRKARRFSKRRSCTSSRNTGASASAGGCSPSRSRPSRRTRNFFCSARRPRTGKRSSNYF